MSTVEVTMATSRPDGDEIVVVGTGIECTRYHERKGDHAACDPSIGGQQVPRSAIADRWQPCQRCYGRGDK